MDFVAADIFNLKNRIRECFSVCITKYLPSSPCYKNGWIYESETLLGIKSKTEGKKFLSKKGLRIFWFPFLNEIYLLVYRLTLIFLHHERFRQWIMRAERNVKIVLWERAVPNLDAALSTRPLLVRFSLSAEEPSCNHVLCVSLSNRAAAVCRCRMPDGPVTCQCPAPSVTSSRKQRIAVRMRSDTAPQQPTTALVLDSYRPQHNRPRGPASSSAFYDLLDAVWLPYHLLSQHSCCPVRLAVIYKCEGRWRAVDTAAVLWQQMIRNGSELPAPVRSIMSRTTHSYCLVERTHDYVHLA